MSGAQTSTFADPNILYKTLSGAGYQEVEQNRLLNQQRTQDIGEKDMAMVGQAGASPLNLNEDQAAAAYPQVPFYVAAPSPSIDFEIADGADIPIEQRAAQEVATITGKTSDGRIETVQIVPDGSPVANFAFDVTPARLVTGLITERGVITANRAALAQAFPERAEVRPKSNRMVG